MMGGPSYRLGRSRSASTVRPGLASMVFVSGPVAAACRLAGTTTIGSPPQGLSANKPQPRKITAKQPSAPASTRSATIGTAAAHLLFLWLLSLLARPMPWPSGALRSSVKATTPANRSSPDLAPQDVTSPLVTSSFTVPGHGPETDGAARRPPPGAIDRIRRDVT